MKSFIVIILLLTFNFFPGRSQEQLAELIKAEKDFAALSESASTRSAFLEYLADDAVLFRRGVVNGKKFWTDNPESTDKLTWEPQYADISAGGDFGYTSGPFKQFRNRTDASPAGGGHYISVWQKLNGKWKVLMDAGVGHQPADVSGWESKSAISTVKEKNAGTKAKASVMELETRFQEAFKQKGPAAFTDYLSTEARLFRPMKAPYRKNNIPELLAETDKTFSYELPVDVRVAPAGDMAFDYGAVSIEVTRDGNVRKLTGNYLRIWKKENGKDWKIVADVISL